MVNSCCVTGCKNESYPGSRFSFHGFPKNENQKLKRENAVPGKISKSSVVCSEHFKCDDFIPGYTRKMLKPDTVPSIFPKMSAEDVLCQECYTILERASLNLSSGSTAVRAYGHQQVCFVCGSSILRAKTHKVSIDSPEGNVIMACIPTQQVHRLERVCLRCWTHAYRSVRRQQTQSDQSGQQQFVHEEVVASQENMDDATSRHEAFGDSMLAVDKKEIKVFCPKCKTKVLHNVEGMQKDETSKIIIANVYHYFEQEYEELTKMYEGVDLTPLSKFSERTALATGVSESTVLEILQERARRNADVPKKAALKRPRQPESSSEEDSSGGDEDDGEHSTTEHVDEPEVYVELAGVKTEPDACGDDRELADPISVHVKTEPQDERDATSSETVAVQSAAKRHKGSIKQRHAEAPPASCAAPSGHSECETVTALSAAKRHKGTCVAPSGQLSLPPDQQLKVENPLTNEQGFS